MTSQDQHTENAACVDSGEFAPQEQAEGAPGAAEQSLTFADEENPDPPCEVQRAEDCPEQSVPLEDLETQGHEAPAPEEYGEELPLLPRSMEKSLPNTYLSSHILLNIARRTARPR
uniref:Calpain-like cysteine peptidase,putative,cysteine peptidase, Clan CA, family C2, putative n=1 Tax=Leishmania guyanensis TaxID=5670 RepID=A0A1E1IVE9_LEIGU